MKRIVFLLAAICLTSLVYAQSNSIPDYQPASGKWSPSGNRLYQNDAGARLAKINVRIPQSGAMVYDFNARYESGAEDGHGGFGLHVFADTAYNSASWGSGKSYLLWLNYDENPDNGRIPGGLSAQVYRSYTNSRMDLVESVSLNEYASLLTDDNLTSSVPFRIVVDGSTGEIRVYDPTDPNLETYRSFYIDRRDIPLNGNWVALRTNGISMSFALGF
ncbi:MAG: hypothetical protein LBB83_09460 [Treponema sp.]|jgi:hypothetical protein|nr:hypothetical protein [Treponema sp.]